MKNTRSASATVWFAQAREYDPGTPTASGWSAGNVSLALSDVATGMFRRSASSMSCLPPFEVFTPPPAIINGLLALASALRAALIDPESGSGRNGGRLANWLSIITSISALFLVISPPAIPARSKCVGPGVPVVASRIACRKYIGSWLVLSTRALYLVFAENGAP